VAAFITVVGIVMAIAGVLLGAYFKICGAIRREDRMKGSLRFDAPSQSARSARSLIGISNSKWG